MFLYKVIYFVPFQIATTNMDSFKTNKKIKLNNFYLDNTKQLHSYTTSVSQIPTSTNVTNPGDNGTFIIYFTTFFINVFNLNYNYFMCVYLIMQLQIGISIMFRLQRKEE